MGSFVRGADLYESQKARFDAVSGLKATLFNMLAAQGRADARELTSGGISSATLAALGHPFGRLNGSYSAVATGKTYLKGMRGATTSALKSNGIRGRLPMLPLNRQSGELHDSIRAVRIRHLRGIEEEGLYTDVEYAKYILNDLGTVFMVGRGFQAEMARRWRVRSKALIDSVRDRQRQ